MATDIESPIGFSDSELCGYEKSGYSLTVRVKAWNGKMLVLRFRSVIGQRDLLAGDFSAAVRGSAASEAFFQEALKRNYPAIPSTHSFQVYTFVDHDDEPALEVVAAACEVSVEAQRGR